MILTQGFWASNPGAIASSQSAVQTNPQTVKVCSSHASGGVVAGSSDATGRASVGEVLAGGAVATGTACVGVLVGAAHAYKPVTNASTTSRFKIIFSEFLWVDIFFS
jgi:hypothetical protein